MGRNPLVVGPDHPQFIALLEQQGYKWERGTFSGLYGIKIILDKDTKLVYNAKRKVRERFLENNGKYSLSHRYW